MTTRAFFAIDVDDALLEGAAAVAARLRENVRARWVNRGVMHATVQFLGDVDDERLATLVATTPSIGQGRSPSVIRVSRVDAFPDRRRARVLVLPLEDAGFFEEIHSDVEAAIASLGFERDDRVYRPHLTLARLRAPADVRKLVESVSPSIEGRALALTLYASKLGPEGPTYSVLARRSL